MFQTSKSGTTALLLRRTVERSFEPLTPEDLQSLRVLAVEEHESFFRRNPHLRAAFGNSLIAICLCQGAALHFLAPSVGVKDYDVWHFYIEHAHTTFPYRAHARTRYKGRRVDFLKRAVPERFASDTPGGPDRVVLGYLLERNTKTKRMLLEKAVIGLHPEEIFGKTIWAPQLRDSHISALVR